MADLKHFGAALKPWHKIPMTVQTEFLKGYLLVHCRRLLPPPQLKQPATPKQLGLAARHGEAPYLVPVQEGCKAAKCMLCGRAVDRDPLEFENHQNFLKIWQELSTQVDLMAEDAQSAS